jgi:hypothetical protein
MVYMEARQMEAWQIATRSYYISLLAVLVTGIAISACTASPTPKATQAPTSSKEGEIPTAGIIKVMEAYLDELMEIPGVVGVGIGQSETTGERFISVLVDEMTPELRALLPTELEGFQVKPQVIGPIEIQEPTD